MKKEKVVKKCQTLFKQNAITLIALVITIIVLLILTGVSISFITGSDGILSRAESAVKVTNEAGIEEETEMAILEKMAEYYESYDEKVVNYPSALEYVKSELVEAKNYTTSSGASLIYDETNGNFLYIKDGKTIKMIADENGKVKIAKGTVSYDANGGTGDVPIDSSKYDEGAEVQINFSSNLARAGYNFLGWSTDKNATVAEYTESGNKKFEIGTYAVTLYAVWEWIPVTVTVQDIANHPEVHYGGKVTNYECTNSEACGWKILHSDGTNIYLIADNCITAQYVPNGRNGTAIRENGTYALFLDPIFNDYNGSVDIESNLRKWLRGVDSFTSANMRATAYMLDTTVWNDGFKGTNADYAVGGPTLDLLVAAYNQKNSMNQIEYEATNIGYRLKFSEDVSYNNTLKINEKFGWNSPCNAVYCWVASPSNYHPYYMMLLYGWGNLFCENIGGSYYSGCSGSFRPVICLNSNVELERVSENEYIIK